MTVSINQFEFAPTTDADTPDPVELYDYTKPDADLNLIVKQHPGYPPKTLRIGALAGVPLDFVVRLEANTRADLLSLWETWKALRSHKGTLTWNDNGEEQTAANCSLLALSVADEFPLISGVQKPHFVVNLSFLEAD